MAGQSSAVYVPQGLTELHLHQWKIMFEHLTGLQLAGQRDSLVRSVIAERIGESGSVSTDDYLHRLQTIPVFSRREWDVLIEKLVIGETRFFRYRSAFDFIGNCIDGKARSLPAGEKLTAWSVGCSSGEEAFSLAMVMHRRCNGGERQVPFSVVGTDINGYSLTQASRAVYRNILERGVDDESAFLFFDRLGNGSYRIKEFLRTRVAFFRHNMLEPVASALLPPMDLISCQNVLMYLQPWRRRAVIRHLVSFLKVDGVLVLCPGDLSSWKPDNLERLADHSVLGYRRVY